MRRAAKVDRNQAEVVNLLWQCGASVEILSAVGQGVPDLLVGWRDQNFLLELKDGEKPPSARALTADERDWHAKWNGQVDTVDSFDAAWEAILRGKR